MAETRGLTDPVDARKRCISAFDMHIYDSVYLKLKRAFGMTTDEGVAVTSGYSDQIPRYPDIWPKEMTLGRSPRMMTASNVAVSRVATKMPIYKYPQLNTLQAMIRQEVMRVTYHGEQHCYSPWHHHVAAGFDDGDSIGYGAVEIWPVVNPNSRLPQAQAQQVSCLDIAWDPHKRDPHDSRFVVTQKWVGVEEAAERIGWKKAKAAMIRIYETATSQYTWSVRCVTYYDYGYGDGGKPVIMEFWGNIWHDPEYVYENPVGRPPFAWCINYCKPKWRRPLGRVDMQAQDFETMFQLEQAMLDSALNGRGAVLMDVEAIDPQSLLDFKAGLTRFLLYNSNMDRKPFDLVPTDQMQQALLPAIQWYAQQYSQNSGVNDLDRGSNSDRKTATQNLIEDRNASANMGWTLGMMLKFQMEIGHLAVDVMRVTDKHPRLIDVMGSNLPINMPGVMASSLYAQMAEPSRIEIDADTLTVDDDKLKQAADRELLMLTMQSEMVGTLIDPRWFAERWIKLFGDVDPRTALMQAQAVTSGAQPAPMGGMQQFLPQTAQQRA